MDTPLLKGNGAGVKAHSIRRKRTTPPLIKQRSFSPSRPEGNLTPTARRKITMVVRQRSISPGELDTMVHRTRAGFSRVGDLGTKRLKDP